MRRIKIFLIAIATACTLYWWLTRDIPIDVVLVEVERGKVEASIVNTRAGSVEACLRTRLSPIVGGRIAYLGIKKGDHVKKGQVLLRLWNDDMQAQSAWAQTQVITSQKRIAEFCSIADNADREAQRMIELHSKGFISNSTEEKSRYEAKLLARI